MAARQGHGAAGSDNVKIEAPITVTFSMPMDRASTEAAFKLLLPESRTPTEPLPGVFIGTPTAPQ